MPSSLEPNQVIAAVSPAAAKRVLELFVESLKGRNPVFNNGKCGLRAALDIEYAVHNVVVDLRSPHFAFTDFEIDTTLHFRFAINFSELYDCIDKILFGFLPPRCIKLCIPFTDKCWSKCLNLGQIGFSLPIPISFDLTGLYEPTVELIDGGQTYRVYPRLQYISPFVIDVGRTIERICQAIADVLPWPLDKIAGKLCEIFGEVFDFLEDAINWLALNIVKLFFDVTKGWIGLPLNSVRLLEIPRHRLPGTGEPLDNPDPENPAVPVLIEDVSANVNGANELDVRMKILPAP